jgi:hypothetical protein
MIIMKKLKLFTMLLVIPMSIAFVLNAQESYVGKIKSVPNPCLTEPCLAGMVLALDVDTADFVVSVNGYWLITEKIVDNMPIDTKRMILTE